MSPTHRQMQLVEESFAQVRPIATDAAQLFYDRLFVLDPDLRPLFASADMQTQGKKLMQTLAIAVGALRKPDELVPVLERLGERHVRYGVTDAHYDTVGAALLWTLEKGLGGAFTDEVREAWATTYGIIATVMKAAAAKAEAPSASASTPSEAAAAPAH